jgi:hypothetical protein
MDSGVTWGHALIIVGCFLTALNLTLWYKDILSSIQGARRGRKPRLYDGLLLLSGLLLIMGGFCSIVTWVVETRL